VTVEPLKATDFSRPLARVLLDSAPAEVLPVSAQRVRDLAATAACLTASSYRSSGGRSHRVTVRETVRARPVLALHLFIEAPQQTRGESSTR